MGCGSKIEAKVMWTRRTRRQADEVKQLGKNDADNATHAPGNSSILMDFGAILKRNSFPESKAIVILNADDVVPKWHLVHDVVELLTSTHPAPPQPHVDHLRRQRFLSRPSSTISLLTRLFRFSL